MTSVTLKIEDVKRRALTAKEAAKYCGVTDRRFAVVVGVKHINVDNKKMYDIHDLDEWFERLKNNDQQSVDDIIAQMGN